MSSSSPLLSSPNIHTISNTLLFTSTRHNFLQLNFSQEYSLAKAYRVRVPKPPADTTRFVLYAAMPRHHPRRIHHHVSLSFTTSTALSPQLYEWVSTGFPVPVSVEYYSVATRHSPVEGSSVSLRGSRSGEIDGEGDVGGEEGVEGALWEELGSYVGTSESSVERVRRSGSPLRAEGPGRERGELEVGDPWTVWSPPTPPQRSTCNQTVRASSSLSPVFFVLGVAASVALHYSRARDAGLDSIDEHKREGLEELGQMMYKQGRRLDEREIGHNESNSSEPESSEEPRMCGVCSAIVQKYAQRRTLSGQ